MLLYIKHTFFQSFSAFYQTLFRTEKIPQAATDRSLRQSFQKKPGGTLAEPQTIMPQNIHTQGKRDPGDNPGHIHQSPGPHRLKRTHYILKNSAQSVGIRRPTHSGCWRPRPLSGFPVHRKSVHLRLLNGRLKGVRRSYRAWHIPQSPPDNRIVMECRRGERGSRRKPGWMPTWRPVQSPKPCADNHTQQTGKMKHYLQIIMRGTIPGKNQGKMTG